MPQASNTITISVITVVYNSVETVLDAIQSVASQNHPHIEHIVIDGASTDGTAELIAKHSGGLAHFISESDKGIYDAMNKGLSLATGDVIGFLNADDVYAHEDVLCDVARCHRNSDLQACYADLIYLDNINDTKVKRYWRSKVYKPGLCFTGWMPAHPTLYIKRRAFTQIGQFNIELGNQADLEFCARAFEIHKLSSEYVPSVWVKMRTGGVSQANILTMIRSNWASYLALKKLGSQRNPISFFVGKFGAKLPQFFNRGRNR